MALNFFLIKSIIKISKNTDIVITGEGSIDSQSLNEKGPVALMKYIKKINSNIIRIAIGRVDYYE